MRPPMMKIRNINLLAAAILLVIASLPLLAIFWEDRDNIGVTHTVLGLWSNSMFVLWVCSVCYIQDRLALKATLVAGVISSIIKFGLLAAMFGSESSTAPLGLITFPILEMLFFLIATLLLFYFFKRRDASRKEISPHY